MLRRLRGGSPTALIIPVRSHDDVVDPSARERGMPAHVTVLYPFLPHHSVDGEVERTVASLVGGFPAFEFTLDALRTFPGVVYLAPRPAAPFVALTAAVVERWPHHPPYEGAYEDVVPHLTVAYGEEAPDGLAERLPLTARADDVWLMTRTGRRWERRGVFPLAGEESRPTS